MVRGRMPFPAAWITMRHVDSSRKYRPGGSARPYAQANGRVRSSLPGGRSLLQLQRGSFQCRELSNVLEAVDQAAAQGVRHGGGAGQRTLAPRPSTPPLAQRTSSRVATGIPSALQSRTQPCGAGMEVDAPHLHAQRVLRDAVDVVGCRSSAVCKMGSTQPPIAPIMRNYLRRCV